jgi:hypothetical protein
LVTFGVSDLRLLGVAGGHLLLVKHDKLIAVDLESGEQRLVKDRVSQASLVANRLIVLLIGRPATWIEIDLATLKTRELYTAATFFGDRMTMAVSPKLGRIAFTEFVRTKPQATPREVRIAIVDLHSGKSRLMTKRYPSRMFFTGGGHHHIGPAICWSDENTLLIAEEKTKLNAKGEVTLVRTLGETTAM